MLSDFWMNTGNKYLYWSVSTFLFDCLEYALTSPDIEPVRQTNIRWTASQQSRNSEVLNVDFALYQFGLPHSAKQDIHFCYLLDLRVFLWPQIFHPLEILFSILIQEVSYSPPSLSNYFSPSLSFLWNTLRRVERAQRRFMICVDKWTPFEFLRDTLVFLVISFFSVYQFSLIELKFLSTNVI